MLVLKFHLLGHQLPIQRTKRRINVIINKIIQIIKIVGKNWSKIVNNEEKPFVATVIVESNAQTGSVINVQEIVGIIFRSLF